MNVRSLLLAAMEAPFLAASPPIRPRAVDPFSPLTRAEFVDGLERFYAKIDAKGRGYFTAADLVLPGYHTEHPPVPYFSVHLAQAPFSCVDTNRDGKITHAEYVAYGVRPFDALARSRPVVWGDLISLGRAIDSDGACK